MLTNAQANGASLYREKSAALRLLAGRTRFPETRAHLLALAKSFEKLAERVEGWQDARSAAD